MTDKYAVVGNPISHSKSPLIHAAFAKQTDQDLVYEKLEAPLDDFTGTVDSFFKQAKGKGLNVTVPFKEQAWQMCVHRSERAELAGAVNTLYLDSEGSLCGDNTDGFGLVADLKRNQAKLSSARVLVVGAGGAVRGVLQPILAEDPAEVVICNRTFAKAESLAQLFSSLGRVSACGFDDVSGEFDLVINGTSASLSGELPPIPASIFKDSSVAYDMMYGKDETVFNQWARESGAKLTIDGLGMLVGQAAEAFNIWRQIMPEIEPVLMLMRDQ